MNNTEKFSNDAIFKYGEYGHLKKTLSDLSLKFATAQAFNDPFEFSYQQIHYSLYVNKNSIRQIDKNVSDAQHKAETLFDTMLGAFRITCFSKTPTQPLMWAHYANKHEGICYCFNKTKIFSQSNYTLAEFQYSSMLPKMLFIEQSTNHVDFAEQVINVIITKSNDWKYEKEIRCYIESSEDAHYYAPDALEAIILGCKFESGAIKDVERLVDLFNKKHNQQVKVLHSIMSGKNYEVEIIDSLHTNKFIYQYYVNIDDEILSPIKLEI